MRKRNTASKEKLQEQGKKKEKKKKKILEQATEELIQRYSIYIEQLSRSQTFNGGQTQRARGTGTTRETLERNTTRRREGSGEETGEQGREREREKENGA